ncbi:hypothetical protein ACFOWM_05685 [Ferruginibacter yonginensis]|uniref:DUF4197 domain-containing protein n=1 Tax=Ferruginibacter yonginensis TaxID=1310416 RepID=A0ABV8QRH2_9BACT
MTFKSIICSALFIITMQINVHAQIKVDDVLGKVTELLGKKEILTVRKGFNPVFSLGKLQINKNGLLGEKLKGVEVLGNIFNSKGINDVTKLYKTYKTGLVVYKVLAAAGTVAATYSTIRGIAAENKFDDKTVKAVLTPAITSILTGVVTKILTKKASYKAVDIFNGVVKRKVKDIFSIAPATNTAGVGIFVKL